MADLRVLKDKAAELASKGKVEKAAELFREILRADPRDVASCQKLADVLRRGGEIAEAVERYAQVAERFARDGLLIKAIAICKTILELDPEHVATQRQLAELYAKRSVAEVGRAAVRPRLATPAASAIQLAPPVTGAGVEGTLELTTELEPSLGVGLPLTPAPEPSTVVGGLGTAFDPSELPLELGGKIDPFSTATPSGSPHRPGEEPADWLEPTGARGPPRAAEAAPAVAASPVHHPSALNLIVAAAEQAVEAGVDEEFGVDVDLVDDEAVVVLEFEVEPEAAVAGTAPDARLPRIPIFSDLGPQAFVALTEAIQVARLAAGETVITEGDIGTSFFVVATGRLLVKKRDEKGDQVVLAHLGEGDFFGEMALLATAPRNATVVAEE